MKEKSASLIVAGKDWVPRYLVPVALWVADAALRRRDLGEWKAASWGIYLVAFLFSLLLWNGLATAAAGLRRSRAAFLSVLALPAGLWAFVLFGHYASFRYFGFIPNYYIFDYLRLEPAHFLAIIRDQVGPLELGVMVATAAGFLAVLWVTAPVPPRPRPRRPALAWGGFLVALISVVLVLNNNLRYFDQSLLPEPNASIITGQLIINRLTDRHVGIQGFKPRMVGALSAQTQPAHPLEHNALVIINEGLNRTRMSLYGYARPTTPNLEAFFQRHPDETFDFPLAECSAISTSISLGSLSTGLSPALPAARWHSSPLIFEYLKTRGLHTFYFSSQAIHWENLDVFFKTDALDVFFNRETSGKPAYNDTGIDDVFTTDALLAHLASLPRAGPPFFGYFQFNGTHVPYVHPPEFHRWAGGEMGDDYDDAVLYIDHLFGRVFEQLEQSGALDRTAIIFTSDHNESLDKNETRGHFSGFYETQTHIPFWVFLPQALQAEHPDWAAQLRRNQDRMVGNEDIVPTLLELYELDQDPAVTPFTQFFLGGSLLRPLPEPRLIYILNQTDFNNIRGHPGLAILEDARKYIVRFRNNQVSEHLFDLRADPNETRDLWPTLAPDQQRHWRALAYRHPNSRAVMKTLGIEE